MNHLHFYSNKIWEQIFVLAILAALSLKAAAEATIHAYEDNDESLTEFQSIELNFKAMPREEVQLWYDDNAVNSDYVHAHEKQREENRRNMMENTYESPRDQVNEPSPDATVGSLEEKGAPWLDGGQFRGQSLFEWIDNQEWRSFQSNIGKPGNRGATVAGDENSVTISYVKVEGSGTKGCMLISPGQREPASKYSEIMYDLTQQGYGPIYAIDHRGQGRSSRLIDNPFKDHVEKREDFTEDLDQWIETIFQEDSRCGPTTKTNLLCHSMGCAITFSYLIEKFKNNSPVPFRSIVGYAPLVKPVTDPFPYPVAIGIGQAMALIGLSESYAPSQTQSLEDANDESNFPTASTRSLTRWRNDVANCWRQKDKEFNGHLGVCVGGVTGGFAQEFFRWFNDFEIFQRDFPTKLTVPILIQQASADRRIRNDVQEEFVKEVFSNLEFTKYEGSQHNIWQEVDAVSRAAKEEAYSFFDEHSQNELVPGAQYVPLKPTCFWNWYPCKFNLWGRYDCDSCRTY